MVHPGAVNLPTPVGPHSDTEGSNPSGLIYGVLAIATVIAAESTRQETYGKVLAASAVTLVMYWLAHAYSWYWGYRLAAPERWSVRYLATALYQEAPMLIGAILPMLSLVAARIDGASLETGITAALWCAALEIVMLEVAAGIRARLSLGQFVLQVFLGALMGVGILLVRLLLH